MKQVKFFILEKINLVDIRASAVMQNAKWKHAETLVLRGINLSYTAMRESTIYYVGLQPLAVS
jgi:hypothetical protein